MIDILVHEVDADTERGTETLEGEGAIGFKELSICQNAHFSDIETCMWCEEAGWNEMGFLKSGCKIIRS